MSEALTHNQSLPVARVSEDGRVIMVLEDCAGVSRFPWQVVARHGHLPRLDDGPAQVQQALTLPQKPNKA